MSKPKAATLEKVICPKRGRYKDCNDCGCSHPHEPAEIKPLSSGLCNEDGMLCGWHAPAIPCVCIPVWLDRKRRIAKKARKK